MLQPSKLFLSQTILISQLFYQVDDLAKLQQQHSWETRNDTQNMKTLALELQGVQVIAFKL